MEMNNQAVTWATENDRKRDMRHRAFVNAKSAIALWWHGVFWKTLWFTRLAKPYSKTMCWLGLYRKFSDGRCMYCGQVKQ